MLQKLVYLVALERERHFGRAARACNVSQPTLSNAIHQLEDELQVRIVESGHSFKGFTPEGLKVVDCARRILAAGESLKQELGTLDHGLAGTLHLGCIPTALPTVCHLVAPFTERYPRIHIHLLSLSSRDIQRGLDALEVDAGITYLDDEPLTGVCSVPLYHEQHFLLTRRGVVPDPQDAISWAQAAALPLCLLTPAMQNRHIIDAAFAQAGHPVTPAIETGSLITLYTTVRLGPWSSIIPGQLLALMPPDPALRVLPLTAPDCDNRVGLVYRDCLPPVPAARVLAALVVECDVAARITAAGRDALVRTRAPLQPHRHGPEPCASSSI